MNEPTSLAEISDCIRLHPKVAVFGARSKPRLGRPGDQATVLTTTAYTGVIEYQPSEYTITVKAGTPVAAVVAALEEKGQYLPFDPWWVRNGATIGGTVAANAAGPGRVRYGGVRDFIIGATLVDGRGQVLRTGGKVVKNAAGFDVPKFLVGSMGRWGVIAEVTFKVFPRPAHSLTRTWDCSTHAEAAERIAYVAGSRWEPTAIEYDATQQRISIRLSGPEPALAALAAEVGGEPGWGDEAWSSYGEFDWAPKNRCLIRVPLSLGKMPVVLTELAGRQTTMRVSGAGNTLWLSAESMVGGEDTLDQHGLRGLNYHDTKDALWWGPSPTQKIDRALQAVLDPDHRFDAFV